MEEPIRVSYERYLSWKQDLILASETGKGVYEGKAGWHLEGYSIPFSSPAKDIHFIRHGLSKKVWMTRDSISAKEFWRGKVSEALGVDF